MAWILGIAAISLIVVVALLAGRSLLAPAPAVVAAPPRSPAGAVPAPAAFPAAPPGQAATSHEPLNPPQTAIPAAPLVSLPAGQFLTLGEGRFTLWVPTDATLQAKEERDSDTIYRTYDFRTSDGLRIVVQHLEGERALGDKRQIELHHAREKNLSPLETPAAAIVHQGVVGIEEGRRESRDIRFPDRYTSAHRMRQFFYAGQSLRVSVAGTDAQCQSAAVEHMFASLRFGAEP